MRLLTYQMPDELLAIASAGEFDEFDLNAFFEASGKGVLAQFKHKSAVLVNVDNGTLRRILDNPEAMAAVERIEGWRSLGDNIIETIINKSEKVKELKNKAKDGDLTPKEKKELSDEEREYKSKRKLIQEKLIKFATRIPAFMYLTDFRENTLQDVITKIETGLFETVTGLTVKDFHLLVRLKVFNTEQMNQAVFKTYIFKSSREVCRGENADTFRDIAELKLSRKVGLQAFSQIQFELAPLMV
jgi:hypothetical protein